MTQQTRDRARGRSARAVLCRWRGATAALAVTLAACGGGGGSDEQALEVVGPPVTAAALADTATEAQQSVPAVVAGADGLMQRFGAMTAFTAVFGDPATPQGAGPGVTRQSVDAPTLRIQAAQTLACAELLDPPCSGSVTADTNLSDTATMIRAGDWFDLRFAALSGSLDGYRLVYDGRLRLDFLAGFDPNASTLAGLDVKLSFYGLSGSVDGVRYGPVSEALRMQVDAQGVEALTVGGVRYSGLDGVSITSASAYTIGSATVRVAYWGDATRYVDLGFQNWVVVDGRPAVGSQVTVGTAGHGTLVATVVSSSTSTVLLSAVLTVGETSTSYRITGTYPAGGGAPTWNAVAVRT